MGLVSRWQELNENLVQSNNFGGQLLRQVRNASCKLYSKYPNEFDLLPLHKVILEHVCPDSPTPPQTPISPPFSGGQCEKGYRVTYRLRLRNITSCQVVQDEVNKTPILSGPIEGTYYKTVANSITTSSKCRTGTDEPVTSLELGIRTATQDYGIVQGAFKDDDYGNYYSSLDIIDVETADGSPDNCGDLPETYPPDPPIDPSDLAGDFTINNYNNEGDITNSFSVPFAYIAPEFNFPFKLRIGDVDFQLNTDGLSDNSGGGGSGGSGGNGTPDNDTYIPDNYTEEELPTEAVEEEEVVNSEIEYVLIDVTTPPIKGKSILFENSEDNDYFAGYFCWLIDTDSGKYRSPKIPIRNSKTYLKKPTEANGFRLYSVNNAILQTKILKVKEEEAN